ncbi:MAG: hypothetical protein ABID54_04215, partial [Pseudomonadota bacterium]
CWSSGVPIEGEQEGESQPEEAGRGKYSPPAIPERVNAEAVSEGIKGFTINSGNPRDHFPLTIAGFMLV